MMHIFPPPQIDPFEEKRAAEIVALIKCAAKIVQHGVGDEHSRYLNRVLYGDIYRMRCEFARRFGAKRGWILAKTPFALSKLSAQQGVNDHRDEWWNRTYAYHSLLDHPFFYRHPEKPFRPAGIAVHLYGGIPAAAAEIAGHLNIDAVQPMSPSWWYPTQTSLLLFRARPEECP
ncbi:hypothetical protein [Bradyrhizobium sp. F1.13.3]|uniref:hypothetical protein n=1 Tax=Bradyrhizobium sp. F1.13.3 TaxID=3156351 RepID=UPI003392E4CA